MGRGAGSVAWSSVAVDLDITPMCRLLLARTGSTGPTPRSFVSWFVFVPPGAWPIDGGGVQARPSVISQLR